jgi:amidase
LSELIDPSIKSALDEGVKATEKLGVSIEAIELNALGFNDFLKTYMIVQGREAWQCHGDWISSVKPQFAEDIRQRFAFSSGVSQEQYDQAVSYRSSVIKQFENLLSGNCILCIPTTRGLPPLVTASDEQMQNNRRQTMTLTVVASLARLPQISIPIKLTETTTTGLSFLAAHGQDMLLLDFALQYQKHGQTI